jgi:CHAT domain-containing protein
VHDDRAASYLQQALSLVRNRIWRDNGIDPGDIPRRTALATAVQEGRASEAEVTLIARLSATYEIAQVTAELFPAGVPALRDPDSEALTAASPALEAAIRGAGGAGATTESVAALARAIQAFEDIGKELSAKGLIDHAWWLGLAWWAYGKGALALRRASEARDAMNLSADFYEKAGEIKYAADCRQEALDIEARFEADVDRVVLQEVRNVLGSQKPLDRVQSLTRLSQSMRHTGDWYGAAAAAEEAIHVLRDEGYPDPEHAFDAAVDLWVANAARTCTGNGLVGRLSQVAGYWGDILGARTVTDAAGGARAQRALDGLLPLAHEAQKQAELARRELAQRLAVWMPDVQSVMDTPDQIDPLAPRAAALSALDDELSRLHIECNEAASEAQIARAATIFDKAQALDSPEHAARAALEHGRVLCALQRFAEALPQCDLAVHALLDGQPGRLSAFPSGNERELYLAAILQKARALAELGEHRALLGVCEPVVRDIEDERARVSSPYQQSAFLATRAEIYELAAAAAYRLDDTDTLLAITELLKARGALRNRLAPAVDASTQEIDAQFRAISGALAEAVPGSTEEAELRERRGWLATARTIAHAHANRATVPELSISALQGVLVADQAAITWFWLGARTLVVLAIAREGVHRTHIDLDALQRAQLDEYVACLTALGDPEGDRLSRIDELVTALGGVLLPADVRAFVTGKKRLVLSPHRTLHLFPFHAAPEADGYIVEHFAVRYVPNLTSLLMPWHGNSEGLVLAVGVAHFDGGGELPNAAAEASAVATAHGASGISLIDATRAQFTSLPLQDYRCLHLATHGSSVLTGNAYNDPMQSCLFLRDGPINGFDIAALVLRAELVVLAACSSGQRAIAGRGLDRLPGDDIFGLQAVLFDIGVNAVLGTLWPVADETALPILVEFHRAYARGELPEVALQRAVVEYLRDPLRPREMFHWAPYFVSALGMRRPPERQ